MRRSPRRPSLRRCRARNRLLERGPSMKFIEMFLHGFTKGPFEDLLTLLSLPRDRLAEAVGLLATFMVACELTRVLLGTTLARSRPAHVVRCLLTFPLQAITLAA